MSFEPAEALTKAVDHYARLAMTPGFWAYAQHQVKAMEADQRAQGLWAGLHGQVATRVKAAGFRPAKEELGEWWVIPAEETEPPPTTNKRKWN